MENLLARKKEEKIKQALNVMQVVWFVDVWLLTKINQDNLGQRKYRDMAGKF